jgi:hypothetical protein
MSFIVIFLMICFFFVSCGQEPDFSIWYGSSDRNGIMIAIEKDFSAVVVATIPLEIILGYQRVLADTGKQSDTLGAVQHLFGRKGDHFFTGTAQQWDRLASVLMDFEDIVYEGVRPSVEAFARLVIAHAGPLSKSDAIGTLGALASVETDLKDIERVLKGLEESKPRVRIYDTGRFLVQGMSADRMRTYMNQWTELVLHEVKQNRGVEIHD